MPIILPSMLCADPMNMARDIAELEVAGVEMLHVDVMDGHFVPNIAIGFHVVEAMAKATALPLDVHLMLDNPGTYLPRLKGLAAAVSFHYEAVNFPIKLLNEIKAMGAKAGIAIGPATDAAVLESVLPHVDFVLCMTVEPGFAGQSFIESALRNLDVLCELRAKHGHEFILQVDGSVGAHNAKLCAEHGAEWLVVGANCFPKDRSIKEALQTLHSVL
ncbi:MAG: ribulose-phosphate 3-epimerase [Oscillospiraceae bacterium]|nr:ribulose-phosphate 3-epimerase [Oscillospiraceae bacterium]